MQETSFYPDNYRRYLTEAFESRSLRNPNYSLRAFSRDLGLGVSTLTEVLKGKYGISIGRAEEVAKALHLSKEQTAHFIDLIQATHSRKSTEREEARARVQSRLNKSAQSISLDGFRMISDWYHLALLELISLPDFKNDPAWIARKLQITEITVSEALQRMERLGLIEINDDQIKSTEDFSAIGNDTPSQAIRKFHEQILEKALAALQTQTVEQRENSSTVFAINKKDLPLAKKKLLKFRREFSTLLANNTEKNDVYCLSLQFFSLITKEI